MSAWELAEGETDGTGHQINSHARCGNSYLKLMDVRTAATDRAIRVSVGALLADGMFAVGG